MTWKWVYSYVAPAEMCITPTVVLLQAREISIKISNWQQAPKPSKMMSEADKALLDEARPQLMENLDLEGSDLLAQLRKRNVIHEIQEDIIKVLW